MHCWTDLGHVPSGFGPSVVTIGNFDGVHLGHQRVLKQMVRDARVAGTRAVAVTFDPHPRRLHQPQHAFELIVGLQDRLELLGQTGLDAVLLQRYTWEFAKQSPEEFVRRYLVDGLRAATVVVGRDVRFGWQNSGDLSTMLELGEQHGFSVEVIEDASPVDDPGGHRRWSSTWVRDALGAGEVAEAAEILGRPHRVRGRVVRGDARGRELGFPTANLAEDSTGMIPADGVYAGWLTRTVGREPAPSPRMPAAISVGTNPTFNGATRRVEVYVLDRTDLELYDDEVLVEFAAWLRPTLRFESVDELVETMTADVDNARMILREAPPA
ncbi:bifunctional riboflavin kinase/FAD synthetase [Phytoactinopolyspora limicola]|uniref:bifunctional riboflavin kinase/FAD synthetase n=1 Tax=Phytoactinopolyspora limicola TaxID=2715536 RepID=UPI00140CE8CB|nr:bifunctional riboflavin kinase/FAD synthetase [Phytoactinopolyspora limicola]